MDYKTKPIGRRDLRRLAKYLRRLLHADSGGVFPVLESLDLIPDVFPGSNYMVVDDDSMDKNTMARCTPNDHGGYTIEIKRSVYDGAYQKRIGAYLGFICHEICHVFLLEIGYTPILERSFANNVLPPYQSVEWQTKALCGELMIPFEESIGMNMQDIMETYHVSRGFAEYRLTLANSNRKKYKKKGEITWKQNKTH